MKKQKKRKLAKPSELAKPKTDLHQPVFSQEEVLQFVKAGDFMGFEYFKAERLRSKPNRTAKDEKFLTEHDAVEAAMQSDPRAVKKQARQSIDHGAELLLKLIRSKKLFYRADFTDGIERPHEAHDEAEGCLCDRVSWLIREVCKLAKEGRFAPVNTVWHGAEDLVETIHDMALKGTVDKLRFIARHSLYLPSLRARAKTFSHDFAKVQEALELSKDCIVNMDSEALHQLDRPATRLVAEILEDIASWQCHIRHEEQMLQTFQRCQAERPGDIFDEYRGLTLADYWLQSYPRYPEVLGYRDLPPLDRKTWPVWWEKAVKPRLEAPETLEEIKGTAFFEELRKATTSGKDYEVRDELKRRCKPKVKALARPALSAKPPVV